MCEIFAIDASANHGNSANGTNSSLPANHSQNPCGEMFVTSTTEVPTPCGCDFIGSLLYDLSKGRDFMRGKAEILCKFDGWLKPELCLSVGRENVHVHSVFFTREE